MMMPKYQIRKIAVVGNIGGGKTILSRRFSQLYNLPLTHVDSIEFLPGLQRRSPKECVQLIKKIEEQDSWIIDGYGPLDLIENRFAIADVIVFIDLPIHLHFWWTLKRQIKILSLPRQELPPDCNEFNYSHSKRLFKSIWNMHQKMRPELLKIFSRDNLKEKVVHIRSRHEWQLCHEQGIGHL